MHVVLQQAMFILLGFLRRHVFLWCERLNESIILLFNTNPESITISGFYFTSDYKFSKFMIKLGLEIKLLSRKTGYVKNNFFSGTHWHNRNMQRTKNPNYLNETIKRHASYKVLISYHHEISFTSTHRYISISQSLLIFNIYLINYILFLDLCEAEKPQRLIFRSVFSLN